jgi:hypothetical protein
LMPAYHWPGAASYASESQPSHAVIKWWYQCRNRNFFMSNTFSTVSNISRILLSTKKDTCAGELLRKGQPGLPWQGRNVQGARPYIQVVSVHIDLLRQLAYRVAEAIIAKLHTRQRSGAHTLPAREHGRAYVSP